MTSFPRLSSVSSFSSASSEGATQLNGRRTRRRFTREQLITLKAKFRATPHPTREERDALAKQINMYVYIERRDGPMEFTSVFV